MLARADVDDRIGHDAAIAGDDNGVEVDADDVVMIGGELGDAQHDVDEVSVGEAGLGERRTGARARYERGGALLPLPMVNSSAWMQGS